MSRKCYRSIALLWLKLWCFFFNLWFQAQVHCFSLSYEPLFPSLYSSIIALCIKLEICSNTNNVFPFVRLSFLFFRKIQLKYKFIKCRIYQNMYEASGRKIANFWVFNIKRMSHNWLKINLNELLQPWMSQIYLNWMQLEKSLCSVIVFPVLIYNVIFLSQTSNYGEW